MTHIQKIDDSECFKWCLVRWVHPVDQNSKRITKADKDFAKEFDCKVKIRDIHKLKRKKKKIYIAINIFGYKNKVKYRICLSKDAVQKNMLICY